MRLLSPSSGGRRAPRLAGPAALVLATLAALHAGAGRAQSRGELLYDTNCVACHNEKMHWRAAKQAYDWNSLQAQVQRWQQAAALGWRDEDIVEVTRYLNDRFYGFTQASGFLSSSAPAPSAAVPTRVVPPGRP
ncbi:cytochrome C [Variovorax sp. DAIF25]|uniref:cytochrome C n=1 Tax=Variovorax sp. DAIF25 TaxID=3080983 RepID=UPI003D6A7D10